MANFYGDDTNQTVIGGFDRYYGGDGNDALGGDGNSADELYGGFGNDFLIGDGINAFGGGAGTLVDPHFFGPTVNNTGGNNILEGGSGDDALYGLAGDDALYGGAGNESGTMLGGGQTPTTSRACSAATATTTSMAGKAMTTSLAARMDRLYGGDGNDLIDLGAVFRGTRPMAAMALTPSAPADRPFSNVAFGYGGEGDDIFDGGLSSVCVWRQWSRYHHRRFLSAMTLKGGLGNDILNGSAVTGASLFSQYIYGGTMMTPSQAGGGAISFMAATG